VDNVVVTSTKALLHSTFTSAITINLNEADVVLVCLSLFVYLIVYDQNILKTFMNF